MALKLATTHLGTAFESHCSHLLRESLGMSLTRVGGKGDGGVDLRGWWHLPQDSIGSYGRVHSYFKPGLFTDGCIDVSAPEPGRRLRLLAQCKAEKIKAGPRLIREMEGVARRGFDLLHQHGQAKGLEDDPQIESMPDEWLAVPTGSADILDTITTVICTRAGFSSSATVEAMRSRVPMLLLHVPFDTEDAVRLIEWQQKDPRDGLNDISSPYPLPSVLQAAYSNPALAGSAGILGENLELRKEFVNRRHDGDNSEAFSMGLWWR